MSHLDIPPHFCIPNHCNWHEGIIQVRQHKNTQYGVCLPFNNLLCGDTGTFCLPNHKAASSSLLSRHILHFVAAGNGRKSGRVSSSPASTFSFTNTSLTQMTPSAQTLLSGGIDICIYLSLLRFHPFPPTFPTPSSPSPCPKLQKHQQIIKNHVQDIPLSPHVFHYMLILSNHP